MINISNMFDLSCHFGIIFSRVCSAMMIMPLLGSGYIPVRIKIIFCAIITFLIASIYTLSVSYQSMDMFSLIMVLMAQVLIGVTMGFLMHLFFQIFILIGEMISHQSGLSFAQFIEPSTQMHMPIVGQLYLILASFLFLTFDGHLAVIKYLVESFEHIPINGQFNFDINFNFLFDFISAMFRASLRVALPAITALLMVNVAFGVMTKISPHLNIFSLGFPISMVLGMFIIWGTLSGISIHIQEALASVFTVMQQTLGGVSSGG